MLAFPNYILLQWGAWEKKSGPAQYEQQIEKRILILSRHVYAGCKFKNLTGFKIYRIVACIQQIVVPSALRVCLSLVFFTDICRNVMDKNSPKVVSQIHQINYCIIHRKISLFYWTSNISLLLFYTLPFGG